MACLAGVLIIVSYNMSEWRVPFVDEESEKRCHRIAGHFLPDCYLRLDDCHRDRTDHRLRTLHETCGRNHEISVITDEIDPNNESDIAVMTKTS